MSLYRKWRSRSFDDLLGQEHVVQTLRNAVRHSRVAHAYLFTGPRGTGKTSAARILAKAVNCLRPQDGNPCGACEMCVAADEGRAVDLIEIDAASNTSVENVRDLRERVAYAAGEGRHKIYIVDEVHRLSSAAFDAFLKTLEEPPPHVIFVFASTEPHKVPETISSRCQRFDFHRIASSVILDRVRYVAEQEGISVSEVALRLLTLHANGSLRDGLGLLEQVASYSGDQITEAEVRAALGLADATLVAALTDKLLDEAVGSGLAEFNRFIEAGGDSRQLTGQLVEYWRALLLAVTGIPAHDVLVDPALEDALQAHAGRVGESAVVAMLRAMTDQDFSSRFNVPAQLPFEVGFVQAALALGHSETRRTETAHAVREIKEPAIDPPGDADPPATADDRGAVASESRAENPVLEHVQGRPQLWDADEVWPEIVAGMRSRSPSLQAVLRSGHLMKTENGEMTIGFFFDFHRNQFADAKKRRLLEEVVSEVLGTPCRVTCVKTTREEIESLKGVGAVREYDGFVEEVAERLREYHARQLGNGHS